MWGRKSFRESASAHAREWWPAYLVLLTAIAVRLSILFSTALVPQTDGAYYLAQVQSLVSNGGLRFSDTPLLFRLQDFVAQGLTVLANLDQDSAIIWGVKLVDAFVPPLAALPALSFGLIKMTGDLQKNAFALVFFSFLLLAFDTAAPTVLEPGPWFEGEQRPGAAPRPGPR